MFRVQPNGTNGVCARVAIGTTTAVMAKQKYTNALHFYVDHIEYLIVIVTLTHVRPAHEIRGTGENAVVRVKIYRGTCRPARPSRR